MSISLWRESFKSIGDDWINVVTGSIAAVVISVIELIPFGERFRWLPWVTFIIIWSWTWAWAFVRSWTKEHAEVKRLSDLLLGEYITQVRGLQKPNIVWNLAYEEYFIAKMRGDAPLIKQAIDIVRMETTKTRI